MEPLEKTSIITESEIAINTSNFKREQQRICRMVCWDLLGTFHFARICRLKSREGTKNKHKFSIRIYPRAEFLMNEYMH